MRSENHLAEKPRIHLYIQENTKSTAMLLRHIGDHIDEINETLYIKFIKVNRNNMAQVRRMGIRVTPTLIYQNKKWENMDKIRKLLTPPKRDKDNFGYGNLNADEYLHEYQMRLIDNYEDDETEEDGEARGNEIRQKMSQFQKRRPAMQNVDEKRHIKGGRKLRVNKKIAGMRFSSNEDDDRFISASGRDNIEETPAAIRDDETMGDLILEDYYLDEAYRDGKKVGKTVSKRR